MRIAPTFTLLLLVAKLQEATLAFAPFPTKLSPRSLERGTSHPLKHDSLRSNAFAPAAPNPPRVSVTTASTHLLANPVVASLSTAAGVITSAGQSILSKVTGSPPRASNVVRLLIALFAAALGFTSSLRQRFLYPGYSTDTGGRSEPLPPSGPLGCPFVGNIFFVGSKSYGSGDFHRSGSAKLGDPSVWRYYFMGQNFAVLSGKGMKQMLKGEFDSVTSSGVDIMTGGLMPIKSLLFEQDKSRHSFLRRLVGSALTPSTVSDAVPTLQMAAEVQVSKMLEAAPGVQFKMSNICTDYTLDVAWRQILGLKLSSEEVPKFEKAVEQWIKGIMSIRVMLRIAVKSSPGYKARQFVTSKIEERIQQLQRDGPDQSTLSGMLFATDEEDTSKKLSREEVIDNALILIFAGSETSASTLTNAMLFLGLHPQSWGKLVDEQEKMKQKYGDVLDRKQLDDECPYLDAVLKESMRIRAIIGGIPRKALETLIIDGKQIPKGWLIDPSPILTHELDSMTQKEGGAHIDPVTGFVPERWLDEETRPSDDYVPFGYGPRFCLGYNLAVAEMKVFLATMARKISYKLDREENIEWKSSLSVIAQPADGVLVSVESRE